MLDNVDAREEILRKVGEYHFGVYDASVRKRVKALFSALENDGTYARWRQNHGVKVGTAPHQGCAFDLTGGGTFNALAPRVRIATQHPYSRSSRARSPGVLGLRLVCVLDVGSIFRSPTRRRCAPCSAALAPHWAPPYGL